MKALDVARRILFVPVASVRPYLVFKGTLLMLAFDLWITRIEHSGRYGAGGFNVAHFAWLDAVQPSVTPGLTIAVITLAGLLCFGVALAPKPPRWLIALTFLLYTWSWAMSMLDSYQHHYLSSIVLLAFVFFPRLTAREALDPPAAPEPDKKTRKERKKTKKAKATPEEKPRDSSAPWLLAPAATTAAWGYVVLAASIAVIYAYAAYSKTADEWLAGAALQRVVGLPADGSIPPGAEDPLSLFRAFAGSFGFEGPRFFWLMGHSVVIVQIICATGYLLAPFRDVTRSRPMRVFASIALVTALAFHAGAEVMNLKIGWFSWYMMFYALVYLLPQRAVVVAARLCIPVADRPHAMELLAFRIITGLTLTLFGARMHDWMIGGLGIALLAVTPVRMLMNALSEAKAPATAALVSAGIGAAALAATGTAIHLPGAEAGGIVAACLLGAGTIGLLVRQSDARRIYPYGVAASLGALSLFLAIRFSDVRFDFYRNVGGDNRRRGDLVHAYEAYVLANRYAPEGKNRERQDARAPRRAPTPR